MSITVKNLRPGVLILADAGLRLGPGETTETPALTPQIQKALGSGWLARLDDNGAGSGHTAAQPPETLEPAAEGGEPEAAGRRIQKRVILDALKSKNEEITGGAE